MLQSCCLQASARARNGEGALRGLLGGYPVPRLVKFLHGPSDLKFLLTTHSIKGASQGKRFEAGKVTLPKFGTFVQAEADLATMLKEEFSLGPATSLANWAQIASYVAWQAAKTRVKAQAEAEANNEIREGQAHSAIGLSGSATGLC